MEKYAADLAKLKELLQTADNFGDIVKYFFDHLGDDPTFIKLSKPAKYPLVRKTLEHVAASLFKQEVTVTNLLLLKLSKSQFYHGACFIQGRPVNIQQFSFWRFHPVSRGVGAGSKLCNMNVIKSPQLSKHR